MCGISGVYGEGNAVSQTAREVARKVSVLLTHRGPDGDGEWRSSDDSMVLFHRRLSIIGLGNEGRQPARSRCGRYVVSFNGEIYNYLEIADELGVAASEPERLSDTQALLAAFSRWGIIDTLRRLRGMYAIAVWDDAERTLALVTDYVGEKPIYYSSSLGEVYFSSELGALTAPLRDRITIDNKALSHYLSFGFVPTPETIYQQIRRAPAGTVLIFSGREMKTFAHPINDSRGIDNSIDFHAACEKTEALLIEAVRLQLRADVSVGSFLSSGIDSSLISAIAARQLSQPLRTFTVRVPDGSYDESQGAALVARHIGSEHTEIDLPPIELDQILKVVKSYGQPFADPSAVPTRLVCAAARRSVKVCLSGDGADELFAGYRRQRMYRMGRIVGDIPGAKIIANSLLELMPTPRTMRSRYAFAHRVVRGLASTPAERYLRWSYDGFSPQELRELGATFESLANATLCIDSILERHDNLPLEERYMRLDIESNLHDNMIIKTDIASMAESIELRTPFQDPYLVQFAERVPLAVKTHGGISKAILRSLGKKYLPAEILTLPKRGFEVPLHGWLRGLLSPIVQDVVLDSSSILHGLFDSTRLESLVRNDNKLDPDRWARRVWTLLVLGVWLKDSAGEKSHVKLGNG